MPDSRANLFWESGSHRGQYRWGEDGPLVEKLMEKGEIIVFLCTSLMCIYITWTSSFLTGFKKLNLILFFLIAFLKGYSPQK